MFFGEVKLGMVVKFWHLSLLQKFSVLLKTYAYGDISPKYVGTTTQASKKGWNKVVFVIWFIWT